MDVDPQLATLAVLAIALVLFVTEWIAIDLTALLIPVALGILGVLDPAEAFSGFGSGAVLTVAAMFVLSRALVDSHAVGFVGALLQRLSGGRERSALPAIVILAALPSAFVNNTAVVAVFIPIVLALASAIGAAPSRLLLPLSYASIMGGCCTVIGTSTTLLVSDEVARLGAGPSLGFFEPLPFGLVIVAATTIYLLVFGPSMLPLRRTVSGLSAEMPTEYVTEVLISDASPLLGLSIDEAFQVPHPDLVVIEIVRGEEILWPQTEGLRLVVGDLVLVRGRAESVADVGASGHALLPELGGRDVRRRDVTLAELVITRESPLVGRSVRVATQRALTGAAVMAVQRRGSHLRTGIADLLLRGGDTLLVQTQASQLPRMRGSDDFVLVEGLQEDLSLRRRAPLVLAVVILVVVLAALEVAPIPFLAVGAAAVLVLTGCLTMRRAYRSLDLSTLAIMAGTVSLGVAMEKSGVAQVIAENGMGFVESTVGPDLRPFAAIAACWLLTNVLTCIISNLAAAALMLPIAIQTATALDVQSRPFVMTVVYAATLALATPMGYQTNLLVLGPGGYRFRDFVRIGLPLQIVLFVLGVVLVPRFFPF